MGAVVSLLVRRWAQVFLRYFGNSDYLAGMLAMNAIGVARDASARASQSLLAWAVRRLWVTVRLEEKDAELVLAWLREQPEVDESSQLTLYSHRNIQGHSRVFEYQPDIQVTTRLRCPIKDGRSQWIWVTRKERGDGQGERRLPGATVSFIGRNKELLESILEVGREIQRRRREKYLTVVQVYDYGKEHGLNWLHPQEKDRKQPGRSISSVVLPRCQVTGLDQAEALLEDTREFLASELWYTERGIPYRRGYLLHGVPGGGKSSLVMAVASELRLPIYMLQLSSEQMSDETLNTLLQYGMHDPPTILLLEDVDLLHSAVLHRRNSGEDKELTEHSEDEKLRGERDPEHPGRKRRGGGLSLSGLLNALDGPTATTGRLLFMTTNAKDRLDPALLRSGRIDYEVEFREAEVEQIERLFVRFYSDFRSPVSGTTGGGEAGSGSEADAATSFSDVGAGPSPKRPLSSGPGPSTRELAVKFAKQVAESNVQLTTADIQRHLMKRKTDPLRALQELPSLLAAFDHEKKSDQVADSVLGAEVQSGGLQNCSGCHESTGSSSGHAPMSSFEEESPTRINGSSGSFPPREEDAAAALELDGAPAEKRPAGDFCAQETPADWRRAFDI